MARSETRRGRAPEPRRAGAWRVALPRLLLGALLLASPTFLVLLGLGVLGLVGPAPALAAAAIVYAGIGLLLKPLVFGIAAVQAAVESMAAAAAAAGAADARAGPEVESWAPSVRELWLALGRWARSARLRLKASEDELDAARAVLAALPEPLLLLDADRRVVRANAAAEALLGERLVDARSRRRAAPSRASLPRPTRCCAAKAARVVEFELASPVERHLSARLAPLVAARPRTGAAAVLLLNDLTALKRSEQLRADFVANASHELRTPLASLVGFIETLRGPARDDTRRRRALPRHHGRAGGAHARGWSRICCRCRASR